VAWETKPPFFLAQLSIETVQKESKMTIISWLIRIALFIVMLGFAISNIEPVVLRFFGSNLEWRAPLVVHLLVFFAAGAALGLLAVIPSWYRGRRNIAKLEKELKKSQLAAKSAVVVEPADGSTVGSISTRLPMSGI
jgi:lipopolysaccharide assembly protein A